METEVISNLKLSLFLAHNTNVLIIRLGSKDADLYSNPVKSVSVRGGGGRIAWLITDVLIQIFYLLESFSPYCK